MKNFYFCNIKIVLVLIVSTLCCSANAQEKSVLPTEGATYYIEDGLQAVSKKNTRRATSSYWNITSVIENCFDEANIGQYAWLMTADGETKLSVKLAYTGEDSRYKIASQEVKFYFYDGNDIFHDENKELITDTERFVGNYTAENTEYTATVHLTSPDKYPFLSYPYYTFYVVIKVKFLNGGTASVAKNIGISRNGVFLLHGLNSSDACFNSFKNYLTKSGNYIDAQVYLKDYSASNTSSFYANTHENQVVRIGLYELSNKLFEIGVASTKYDMIGHSMGGILERLYCQEVDNSHTYKLITLNTPHFGSLLGNVYDVYKLIQLIPDVRDNSVVQLINAALYVAFHNDPSMQAVTDLGVNSNAIQNLNSASVANLHGIPVCAVGTEIDWINYEGVKYAVTEPFYEAYGYLMAHIFNKEIPHNRNYLNNNATGSDAVVSVDSQKGGCSASYIYKGTWGNAFHCNSPEWNVVHDQLSHLLRVSDSYEFSYNGFANTSGTPLMRALKDSDIDDKYITKFEDAKPTSYIRINVEPKNEVDDNYTHLVKLSHSEDMATIMAFALLSKDEIIADYDKDSIYFNFEDHEDEVTIYAVGRTDYNALLIDSVKVKLGESSSIFMPSTETEIHYSVIDNALKIDGVMKPYTITIYDVAGRILSELNCNPSNTYALPRNKGYLVIAIKTNDEIHTIKLNAD